MARRELSPPTGSPRAAQLIAGEHGHVAVVVAVGPHEDVLTVGYDGGSHVFERLTTRAPRYLQIGAPPATGTTGTPGGRGLPAGENGADRGQGAAGNAPRVLNCR